MFGTGLFWRWRVEGGSTVTATAVRLHHRDERAEWKYLIFKRSIHNTNKSIMYGFLNVFMMLDVV